MQKFGAEFVGTLWLVFGGCGSAMLAAAFPALGIGFAGVSLALGLTLLTVAQPVGRISSGHFNPGFDLAGGFARNGYGEYSPGGNSRLAARVIEAVLTAGCLVVILGETDERAPEGLAPIAIGLTLIHLISIPVTNKSINPARSTGVALFVGG